MKANTTPLHINTHTSINQNEEELKLYLTYFICNNVEACPESALTVSLKER